MPRVCGGLRRPQKGVALVDVRLDVVPLPPRFSLPTVAGCRLGRYPGGSDRWGGERVVGGVLPRISIGADVWGESSMGKAFEVVNVLDLGEALCYITAAMRDLGEGSCLVPFVFECPSSSHDACPFRDVGASDDCPAISFAELFHFDVAGCAPLCTVGRSHCFFVVIRLLIIRCHSSCTCDGCV